MKNLLASFLVVLTVFPTALSKHAIEVDARADKAIAEIGPAAVAASVKGRHYVWYNVKPWSADVAQEIGNRLNKIDGVWTNTQSSGAVYVHFK